MRTILLIILLAPQSFAEEVTSVDFSWKNEFRIESMAFYSLEDLRSFWDGAAFRKEKHGVCGGVECFAVLISNQYDGSRTSFFVYRKRKIKNEETWEVVASRHAIPAGALIDISMSGITLISAEKKRLITLEAESLSL